MILYLKLASGSKLRVQFLITPLILMIYILSESVSGTNLTRKDLPTLVL